MKISKDEMEEQTNYAQEYIALAKNCGIILTEEDFKLDEQKLTDEGLEAAAGGTFTYSPQERKQMAEFILKAADADKRFKEKREATENQN